MYTEEEAKEKGCPLVLINMKVIDPGCGGSKCMAWRWANMRTEWRDQGTMQARTVEVRTGYCGLAGRP